MLVILSLVVLDYATGDATTKFLPFGPGMDSKIHKGIDATKELAVDPPIKLGDQFVSSFFISVNGLIQGNGKDNEYFENTVKIKPHSSNNMLFAYWADVDIVSGDQSGLFFYYMVLNKVLLRQLNIKKHLIVCFL